MKRQLIRFPVALLRTVSVVAVMAAAQTAYAESAKDFAPGQADGVEAPGQAKADGEAAREFAPGHLKRLEETDEDVILDDDDLDDGMNEANLFAPGQQAKDTGEPAKSFAPGQQAKETGEPANSFAPGQQDKADRNDDGSGGGSGGGNAGHGGGNGGGNGGGKGGKGG